jgi:hypothetical protein
MDWANWSTSRKILLPASALLLIILSLFDWQASGPFGFSGWHGGAGVILGLLTIALLVWEIIEGFFPDVRRSLPVPSGLVGAGLALLVALFVLIKFISANEFRHWPAWIGLLLGILIAIGGVMRFTESGEAMPTRASMSSGGSGSAAGGSAGSMPTPPPDPPAAPGGMGTSAPGTSGTTTGAPPGDMGGGGMGGGSSDMGGGGSSDREGTPPA